MIELNFITAASCGAKSELRVSRSTPLDTASPAGELNKCQFVREALRESSLKKRQETRIGTWSLSTVSRSVDQHIALAASAEHLQTHLLRTYTSAEQLHMCLGTASYGVALDSHVFQA